MDRKNARIQRENKPKERGKEEEEDGVFTAFSPLTASSCF